MVCVTNEIFRKSIFTKKEKEAGMEPYTVTFVCTEVFITPVIPEIDVSEVFEIPDINVSDVPEVFDVPDVFNVPEVYSEMLMRCYIYVMLSI